MTIRSLRIAATRVLAIAIVAVSGRASEAPPVPEYAMFYNGSATMLSYSIGLATSSDDAMAFQRHPGNPVLAPGRRGSWDDELVVDPSVVWDGQQWVMYYAGHDGSSFAIGVATSDDLVSWRKAPSNPVLTGTGMFAGGVNFPTAVVDRATGITRLWYTGWSREMEVSIGYAEVDYRGSVTNFGQVLDLGQEDRFDDEGLVIGASVRFEGGWRLYFAGQSGPLTRPAYRTGYATCLDPSAIATCDASRVIGALAGPVTLSGITYNSNMLRSLVLRPDGSYRAFGTAFHSGDGTEVTFVALSDDGVSFATPVGPVLELGPDGAWDSRSAENPVVISLSVP